MDIFARRLLFFGAILSAFLFVEPVFALAMVGTDTAVPAPEMTATTSTPEMEAMPVEEPATISSATVSDITDTSATITVMADKMVQAYLEYGTSASYGMSTPLSAEFSDSPAFLLSGLLSETVYHFRIIAADASGNMTITNDETFKTLAPPAPPAPAEPTTKPTATTTPSSPSATATSTTSTVTTTSSTTTTTTSTSTPSSGSTTTTTPTTPATPTASTTPSGSNTITIPEETAAVIPAKAKPVVAASSGGGGLPAGPFRPLVLSVKSGDAQVVFHWQKHSDPTGTHNTLIIKKEGTSYVKSRIDGEVVYNGTGNSFTDANLQNGEEYHYALYVQGPYERFSPPARFKALPRVGTQAPTATPKTAPAPATLPKAPTDFARDLHRGLKGADVSRLQQFLIDEGYYPEALVTGYFGPLTQSAVTRFQKDAAISPALGYFGSLTRAKTESIINASINNN